MVRLQKLIQSIPQAGKVKWLGIRPARRAEIRILESVDVSGENGLMNDHYSGRDKKRQITLIQWEHLDVIASLLSRDHIAPEILRRNIAVSGINLLALKNQHFLIGTVLMEYTGCCHPCSYIEESLGPGAYNAVRGHGGITARVIKAGTINIGDAVSLFRKDS